VEPIFQPLSLLSPPYPVSTLASSTQTTQMPPCRSRRRWLEVACADGQRGHAMCERTGPEAAPRADGGSAMHAADRGRGRGPSWWRQRPSVGQSRLRRRARVPPSSSTSRWREIQERIGGGSRGALTRAFAAMGLQCANGKLCYIMAGQCWVTAGRSWWSTTGGAARRQRVSATMGWHLGPCRRQWSVE
jgi:hypothetical protein